MRIFGLVTRRHVHLFQQFNHAVLTGSFIFNQIKCVNRLKQNTPYFLAGIKACQSEAIITLPDRGADAKAIAYDGYRPIDYANEKKCPEMPPIGGCMMPAFKAGHGLEETEGLSFKLEE